MGIENLRIFVVDDEPVIANTLAAILQSHGFLATSFTSPEAALESCSQKPPHLLITDVIMPVLTGIELAQKMLALCPECKVLMFSGQAGTVQFATAPRQGVRYEILTKPVHPTELLEKIQAMLMPAAVLQ